MAILFCFASCRNNSSSSGEDNSQITPDPSQDGSSSYIDYSFEDTPESDKFSEEYFEFKNCEEGIYLECDVPKDFWQGHVFIDGIGQVTDDILYNKDKTKGNFFYPYLTPGKEYTVRVVFYTWEYYDEDGFNLGYVNGDGSVGWFEAKVTAGKNSKGEVRLTSKGKIDVQENGNFKFVNKPTFENENLIQDWILGIGLNEGVSWDYPDNRRNKWLTTIEISNKDLLDKTYNFYTYPRDGEDVTKVDFIFYYIVFYYEYNGNTYRSWWGGKCVDTNCTLWTDIDITKSADVAKIQGTWTRKIYEGNSDLSDIPCYVVGTGIMIIKDATVQYTEYWVFTKLDGSFTEEESASFGAANVTISNYRKTAIEEHVYNDTSLSEYFKDGSHEHWFDEDDVRDCDRHYKLQFFDGGGKTLRITEFHDWGEKDEWYYDYQKQ